MPPSESSAGEPSENHHNPAEPPTRPPAAWHGRLKIAIFCVLLLQIGGFAAYVLFFSQPAARVARPEAEPDPSQEYDLISKFDESTPRIDGFSPSIAALAYPPLFAESLEFRDARSAASYAAENELNLHEDSLVLGVSLAGQARAYPITQLCGPRREIINDRLGGRPIAATW